MSELSEIFRKDPLECTEADDDKIIARIKKYLADLEAFDKTIGELKKADRKAKVDALTADLKKEADEEAEQVLKAMRGK